MGRMLAAALVAAYLVLCAGAFAGASIEAVMRERMAWIAARSDYEAPDDLPAVEYFSPSELLILNYGAEMVAQSELPGSRTYLPPVEALYDREAHIIYLPTGYDHNDLATSSVLVHELVHHMQAAGGHRFDCPDAAESDAYALHNRWISEMRTGEVRSDPLFVMVVAQCPVGR